MIRRMTTILTNKNYFVLRFESVCLECGSRFGAAGPHNSDSLEVITDLKSTLKRDSGCHGKHPSLGSVTTVALGSQTFVATSHEQILTAWVQHPDKTALHLIHDICDL